jgi:hypothetical protein
MKKNDDILKSGTAATEIHTKIMDLIGEWGSSGTLKKLNVSHTITIMLGMTIAATMKSFGFKNEFNDKTLKMINDIAKSFLEYGSTHGRTLYRHGKKVEEESE